MRSDSKEFFNKHLFLMEIYITYLLQILCFSSRFRRFEMQNFLRPPTMVAYNSPPPINFFISTGLRLTCNWQIRKFGDENSERKILKNSNCKMVKKPLKFFKHCGNRAKHVLLKCIIQDYFSLKAPSSNFYS